VRAPSLMMSASSLSTFFRFCGTVLFVMLE
jgi:hypothetical protein